MIAGAGLVWWGIGPFANSGFSRTGTMTTVRSQPTATLLAGGLVLFAGGDPAPLPPVETGYLYRP